MSRSWNNSYDALPPAAVDVLRVVVLLELPTILVDDLAVALAVNTESITAAVDTLRQSGWVVTTETNAATVPDGARRWLLDTDMLTSTEPAMVADLASQHGAHVIASLDVDERGVDQVVRWLGLRHRTVLSAIRVATRAGLYPTAIALAMAAWRVADQVPDPSWRRDLAQLGEDAARQARDRDAFFALLEIRTIAT